eukprot:5420327-Pleurochrysis_carterae.AAC.1
MLVISSLQSSPPSLVARSIPMRRWPLSTSFSRFKSVLTTMTHNDEHCAASLLPSCPDACASSRVCSCRRVRSCVAGSRSFRASTLRSSRLMSSTCPRRRARRGSTPSSTAPRWATRTRTYTHAHTHVHARAHARAHARSRANTHTRVRVRTRSRARARTRSCALTHLLAHLHTQAQARANTLQAHTRAGAQAHARTHARTLKHT